MKKRELVFKVGIDTIHFDILQALKNKSDLSYEQIFTAALTMYASDKLLKEQVEQILLNHKKR